MITLHFKLVVTSPDKRCWYKYIGWEHTYHKEKHQS